jgi:serralysin
VDVLSGSIGVKKEARGMAENAKRYCICISKERQDVNGRAAIVVGSQWTPGEVIRARFLEGDESLQQRVRDVAERWTASDMANLTIRWVDSAPSEIRIAFEEGNGSWSYLGTDCRGIEEPDPTMNYGWLTPDSADDELRRVVLHEFGHALGLIHEHQNPEGGIEWNEPAVIADLSGPPNEWGEDTIRRNVLDRYPKDAVIGTDVDGESIMMYPIPASWTLDGFSADLNDDLSEKDVAFIREAYKHTTTART